MIPVKKFILITLSIIILFCDTSNYASTDDNKPKVITKFLQFIIRAESASVKAIDNNKLIYQLELQGVDTSVLYFTNRPRRITDYMTTRFFLKRWIKPPPHDFITNPPNAAILYIDKITNRQQTALVLLNNPVYIPNQQRLFFMIQPITGNKLTLPLFLEKPVIVMGEITVCGVIGAWGDLPGEEKSDIECHKNGG